MSGMTWCWNVHICFLTFDLNVVNASSKSSCLWVLHFRTTHGRIMASLSWIGCMERWLSCWMRSSRWCMHWRITPWLCTQMWTPPPSGKLSGTTYTAYMVSGQSNINSSTTHQQPNLERSFYADPLNFSLFAMLQPFSKTI